MADLPFVTEMLPRTFPSTPCSVPRLANTRSTQSAPCRWWRQSWMLAMLASSRSSLRFGSTGSGKTFSMLGSEGGRQRSSQDGILPRVAAELFRRLEQSKALAQHASGVQGCAAYQVRASFIEVYRESAFDLLGGPVSSSRDPAQACTLREDRDGRVFAEGACEESVRSVAQLLKVVARGAAARATAATGVHAHSSRSHALLVLSVERRWHDLRDPDPTRFKSQVARFTLVDLAGAESMERSHNGAVDAAGVGTNLGLLVLGRVIHALASNERVPYRDSTLTRLMQTCLGGNAVTQMLACIAPTTRDMDISLQTLNYATSARDVRLTVSSVSVVDEIDDDPMVGDFEDIDTDLNRRAIWIETVYGDVFARCVGNSADPLLLYVHGSGPLNSSMMWNHLELDIERIAKERGGSNLPTRFFNVAIDCPGYGRSPGNRQIIRTYPGGLISSVITALGRKSAAALIGSSQGACAVFNCALEFPAFAHTLAVCHPVGHAPQRYDKIWQPSLLIFDVEDAGHPVEVGRQMRRYLQDPRYFEFARSVDGDWECQHMGEEMVALLAGSWQNIKKKRKGGQRDDRLPELTRVAGGFKSWNEPHNGEWGAWCGIGEGAADPEPLQSSDDADAWRAELDPGTNMMVYRHVRTGRCTKVRPRGQRIVVDKLTTAGASAPGAAPSDVTSGIAAGTACFTPTPAEPALFESSDDEDSEVEEQRRDQQAREATDLAEREFAQDACDLCRAVLVEPLRLAGCRCALCACCMERTVRYTRQCPACGEGVDVDGKVPAQAVGTEEWLERLRMRNSTPELDAQQDYLLQLQLARTRVTRILLEYGSVSKSDGSKTSYTSFVRVVSVAGASASVKSIIEKVDFNINPGYSKPTATSKEPKNKQLGYAFEYAMARSYPCWMTIHFQGALGLPKVLLEFDVQERPKVARRIVIQLPSNEKGGFRASDTISFDAALPRNAWIRCAGTGGRQADVEYLPEPGADDTSAHYAAPGPVFAHMPGVVRETKSSATARGRSSGGAGSVAGSSSRGPSGQRHRSTSRPSRPSSRSSNDN
mmetsp:Transcript_104119/g.333880  ORF Transcript_104119/g.333880 Transcript_104119/m.333880 type:complete len:1050 (-) Transcript_104119:186-3335(-)